MAAKFRAACLQLSSSNDVNKNLEVFERLMRRASDAGADLILTPEYSDLFEPSHQARLAKATYEQDNLMLDHARSIARQRGCWIMLGSLVVRVPEDQRLVNRSYLISSDGAIVARYDKVHMFDVPLPDGSVRRESRVFRPGDKAIHCRTPWGNLGLSICYDLRFPNYYRSLAQAGAAFISVPAAWPMVSKASWRVLLHARALENYCFVFAPAQCGEISAGRKMSGNSLVISPRGEVLAEAEDDVGVIVASVDPALVTSQRRAIPSVDHDASFEVVECGAEIICEPQQAVGNPAA
ncbi:carbon-nitrogen hydrolase family protein [Bradyrhizobium sp.]